ncbi:MAG TPA: hypothetical protein VEP30_06000 [Chthoniobacterales bacterium]|nr:hypothetical protein [Chthoniobacterales bacterium]
MKYVFAILLALFYLQGSISGQVLWLKTSYGMTPKEVQQAVPGTVVPKDPEQLSGNAVEGMRLENYPVVGRPFLVRFFFQAGKLTDVMLEGPKEESSAAYLATFDALTDVLRSKYGVESSKKRQDEPGFLLFESKWIDGKTDIDLLLTSAGDASSGQVTYLNLTYSTSLSKEAEKL